MSSHPRERREHRNFKKSHKMALSRKKFEQSKKFFCIDVNNDSEVERTKFNFE